MPYVSHKASKWSLNSLPLSYITCWQRGYRLNQVLFTKVLIIADDLSKYGTCGVLCVEMPLRPFVPEGMVGLSTTGNSTISSQLVAGSIIVRHIKSISVLSFPLRVYGPIRSTHSASQGFLITNLVGSLPYLCLCRLLTWHLWQFLTYFWMVDLIPVQYIAARSVSSRRVAPGCCR